jgi:NDP-sugar pyrophosphorylase family protein
MINQAVVLCAGLGTRLRPLTDKIPKQMILIAGKPLLEHLIIHLKKYGVREFFINLHYLPEQIKNYFGNGKKWGVKITYVHESVLTGTAGGVKNFEKHLKKEFFVVYGDMWTEVNFKKFYDFYVEKKRPAAMVLVAKADRLDVDLVELDNNYCFRKFYHRPHPKNRSLKNKLLLNATYIFSKDILNLVPIGAYCDLDKEILPKVLENSRSLYGYPSNEFVLDLGTFDRLERVRKLVEKK